MCRRIAGRMARARIRTEPIQQEPVLLDSHDGDDVAQFDGLCNGYPRRPARLFNYTTIATCPMTKWPVLLGISPQAVHGRMQRARQLLARRLSNVRKGAIPMDESQFSALEKECERH